jgi:hypothetical protein
MRPSFFSRLPMKRIVKGAVVVGLAGGLGTVILLRPKPVMDVWNKVRHQAPASPSEAWTSVRHHATDAWTTVRRHLPFGLSGQQPERSASVAAATTAVANRDAAESRSTSRRTKKKRGSRE